MAVKRGGLGRNLSALLGSAEGLPNVHIKKPERVTLPIGVLQPGRYQPRGDIELSGLDELATSIKKQGVLQPLLVRELAADKYEIIAGERRWRASQLAGCIDVPVIVHQVDDETAMAIALVENLQREDLNAMDQARAMHRLTTEFDLTHQHIAELLSISRTAVTNHLRLLNLAADVKVMLEHGDIDMGHARCLLVLEENQQSHVAKLVIAKQYSVRETEALVARVKEGPVEKLPKEKELVLFENEIISLAEKLQTKIKIKPAKSGRGTLVLHYKSQENLQAILEQLV